MPSMEVSQNRGHRIRPHTADVIVEAWGADTGECLEEAVHGLVDTHIDTQGAEVVDRHTVELDSAATAETLLDLLDEVIFLLDTSETVPVAAEARHSPAGGVDLSLVLASRDSVEQLGSAPKAISRSETRLEHGADGVSCSFLVDV